jgi:hypothetical protein
MSLSILRKIFKFSDKSIKVASAYLCNDKIVIHSSSQTKESILWVMTEPITVSSADDTQGLGINIMVALRASRVGIPHPESMGKKPFLPVLDLLGVKSMKKFGQIAKCVGIESKEGKIYFAPTKNRAKEKMGFSTDGNTEKLVIEENKPDIEKGQLLLDAFEKSEII